MDKFKNWFAGLSKGAQVAFVSVAVILGLGTYGTIAAPAPNTPDMSTVETAVTEKSPVITTETVTTTEPIPFGKQTAETSSLNKGVTQVTTIGVNGVKTKTFNVTRADGVETKRVLVSQKITTAPVDEVTSVGIYVAPAPAPRVMSNCDPNYTPCVPNVSYDLDCPDIGFSVNVIGSDPHRFDGDNDGYGCESY